LDRRFQTRRTHGSATPNHPTGYWADLSVPPACHALTPHSPTATPYPAPHCDLETGAGSLTVPCLHLASCLADERIHHSLTGVPFRTCCSMVRAHCSGIPTTTTPVPAHLHAAPRTDLTFLRIYHSLPACACCDFHKVRRCALHRGISRFAILQRHRAALGGCTRSLHFPAAFYQTYMLNAVTLHTLQDLPHRICLKHLHWRPSAAVNTGTHPPLARARAAAGRGMATPRAPAPATHRRRMLPTRTPAHRLTAGLREHWHRALRARYAAFRHHRTWYVTRTRGISPRAFSAPTIPLAAACSRY